MIVDAICANEPVIEIPIELAEALALLLKSRARSSKPRLSRRDKLTERSIIATARQQKEELIKAGMATKRAQYQAVTEASERFRKSGRALAEKTIHDLLGRRR